MVVEIIKQFAMVVRVGSSTCGSSRLFILFYIFSILPLIYLPNLKLKKKEEIYVLESVL
jgi:hypothetical protein